MQQTTQKPKEVKRLFGTDGIRGRAGIFPLDKVTLVKIAESITKRFAEQLDHMPKFVIGRDTRESGLMIEQLFDSAVKKIGAKIVSAGVITTPGIAFLTSEYAFDAGIVISASHNPYFDNGIKVFLPNGKKMGEELERLIEADVAHAFDPEVEVDEADALPDPSFEKAYLDSIREKFPALDLTGKKIVIDCANGAASELAPKLFDSYGCETIIINNSPNGTNINDNCGSLHLEKLREVVLSQKADIGIAFDGDADRALFVDEVGETVDGDGAIWVLTNSLLHAGKLTNKMVVATVMSNIGLELALKNIGIEVSRTDVGDKYVLEELLKTGADLGGEQSGHLIFPKYGLVGDGMLTASAILSAMKETGRSLSGLTAEFVKYPQVLYNVRVADKIPFEQIPKVAEAVRNIEDSLNGRGRLLLRYSGTENLARIMIEGEDQGEIDKMAADLGEVIRMAIA